MCKYMYLRKPVVNLGDKIKVVVDGGVKELEVVDMPEKDLQPVKLLVISSLLEKVLGRRYPLWVSVKLPDGRKMMCNRFRPMV